MFMDLYQKIPYLNKIKSQEKLKELQQLHFLKRLSRLIDEGYKLIDALEVMAWDAQLAPISEAMTALLEKGCPLDEAAKKLGFHETVVSYLYFVKYNSNLATSLQKCVTMFSYRIMFTQKFRRIIRYPIILFICFTLLLVFIERSILPAYLDLFQTTASSSKTVQFSILFIQVLSTSLLVTFLTILIGTILWQFIKGKLSVETTIKIYERIPFCRTFIRMIYSYLFATHMGMFLKSGLSIKDVLENMESQVKIPVLAYYAKQMTLKMNQGIYLNEIIQGLSLLDRHFVQVFQRTNNQLALEKDLTAFADLLSSNLERKLMRMIGLIQPIFFVILATFIIFIYFILISPMFQLIQNV